MNDVGVALHYHNGEPSFLAAVKKAGRLEFDRRYLDPDFRPAQQDSPVVGIRRTAPKFFSPELERIAASPPTPFPGSVDDFGVWFRDMLVEHLRKHWDPTHPTLVLHSSGYDSRMLSLSLARLRNEGFNLGTVHFRCHGTEGPTFLQIMKRERWHPSQYSVFPESRVDPFDAGRWDMPGTSPWLPAISLVNFWSDIVSYEDEKHWNICGGAGGDAAEYRHLKKPLRPGWRYCENEYINHWLITCLGFCTDFLGDLEARFHKAIFPLLGEGHVRAVAQMDNRFVGYDKHGCDLSRAPVLKAFPGDLLSLPRARRVYSWKISDGRWAQMEACYARSRFLREIEGAPPAAELIEKMKVEFRRKKNSERVWRLAALWEQVGGV